MRQINSLKQQQLYKQNCKTRVVSEFPQGFQLLKQKSKEVQK